MDAPCAHLAEHAGILAQAVAAAVDHSANRYGQKALGLSQLLARNYDIALTDQDVELYMDRMERSLPRSREAGKMSVQELDDYLETLRRKKGAEEPGGSPGTTR